MPTYLTPGVYIEELADSYEPSRVEYTLSPKDDLSAFPKPRWLSEHSTAAFVGFAARGPFDVPVRLTRWMQFEDMFGEPLADAYLSDAVRGFFANGGRDCYVVRVGGSRVGPDVFVADSQSIVRVGGSELGHDAFVGDVQSRTGFGALDALRDVSIVCVPDVMSAFVQGVLDLDGVTAIQGAMMVHCERMGERIAILDSPPGLMPSEVREWRQIKAGYDSKFATLYYPWVEAFRPFEGRPARVPPSGHVAGVYARTDLLRGPHQTPANEPISGVSGLETHLLLDELGVLNSVGINGLVSSGRGVLVFGSRTLSSDPDWRHLRKRRLVNFIRRNIQRGTEWVIFERADDERVWARILRDLDDLLSLLWRSGALWGDRPNEAYSLKCDGETNPPEVSSSNLIIVECSVAPDPVSRLAFRVVYFCD